MRNLFSLILVVGFLVSCSTDDAPIQVEQSSTELMGTWEAVSESLDGEYINLGITYDYLTFKSNGIVTEGRDGANGIYDGLTLKYTLNGNDLVITDDSGYITYHKIIKINNSELLFTEYADKEKGQYIEYLDNSIEVFGFRRK